MFGINLKALKWALSWNFAFLCLLCIALACRTVVRTLHLQINMASSHPWVLMLDAVFPAMATVFGVAWWKVWKERTSARAWGIVANILITALPLWHIIRFPRSTYSYDVLVLAVGIAGLLAFSIRDKAPSVKDDEEPVS